MCHYPCSYFISYECIGYHGIPADAELTDEVFIDEPVVVDGSLVTSRGWPDLPYFMPKFLKVLAGK